MKAIDHPSPDFISMTTNMQTSGHSTETRTRIHATILSEITQYMPKNTNDDQYLLLREDSQWTELMKDMIKSTKEGSFCPRLSKEKSKPTLRQPSSAHLVSALSFQILPPIFKVNTMFLCLFMGNMMS